MPVKKIFLCIHQGWELYGSDRSFLLNLKLFKEIYSENLDLEVIIPFNGPIVNELEKITSNITIEDIGKIERNEGKTKPIRSIFKVLKASITARKKMKQVDLVYINTIVPFGYLLASFFLRKKVIIHVREIPSPFFAKIFAVWFKTCRVNLIFNSFATQKAYKLEKYKRGIVILNAVEEIKLLPESYLENKLINILLIGRINAGKGHNYFVKTFSNLDVNLRKKFKIRFLGEAPKGQNYYYESLKKDVNDFDLTNYIEFVNFDSDTVKHYNWSDIVIVPSVLPESFGRIAVEAFSVFRPVIAANHGGLSEIVEHNKNGWLFKPSDEGELLQILTEISNGKFDLSEFGKNARISFLEKYTVDIYKVKMKNYLDSVLNNS